MKRRENMYQLLRRLYILEVDQPLLEAIEGMKLSADNTEEAFNEGYRMMKEYASSQKEESLDELAVDYARIFLTAGVAEGTAAFPYESVYTGKKKLIGQESSAQTARLYAEKKMVINEELPKVPSDHIGVELAFMAQLCKEAEALQLNWEELKEADALQEQQEFFEQHLDNWVPLFCQDIEQYAETEFYKGVGQMTKGFIEMEHTFFAHRFLNRIRNLEAEKIGRMMRGKRYA